MIKSRWAQYLVSMQMISEYTILIGEPDGMRPLGGPRHKWENNE
jgi:hypothetical protein